MEFKKINILLLAAPLILSSCSIFPASPKYAAKDVNSYFKALKNFEEDTGYEHEKTFQLKNDIDFNNVTLTYEEYCKKVHDDFDAVCIACGNIEGNNHTIKNLTIDFSDERENKNGLIGEMYSGTIKNLNLENIHFKNAKSSSSDCKTGILIGTATADLYMENVVVKNCSIQSSSTGSSYLSIFNGQKPETKYHLDYSGGIIGYYYPGYITSTDDKFSFKNCKVIDSEIKASFCAGGVIGGVKDSNYEITGLENINTKVTATDEHPQGKVDAVSGGIIGKVTLGNYKRKINKDFNISNCKNSGEIVSRNSSGGIIGRIDFEAYRFASVYEELTNELYSAPAFIDKCENSGLVNSVFAAGGIVGTSYFGENSLMLTSCVNSGKITSESYAASGVVGASSDKMTLSNCKVTSNSVIEGKFGGGLTGSGCKSTLLFCEVGGKLKNTYAFAERAASITNCTFDGEIEFTVEGHANALLCYTYASEQFVCVNNTFKGKVKSNNENLSLLVNTISFQNECKYENSVYYDLEIEGAKQINIFANEFVFENTKNASFKFEYTPSIPPASVDFSNITLLDCKKVRMFGSVGYTNSTRNKNIDIVYPETLIFADSERTGIMYEKELDKNQSDINYTFNDR